MSIDKNNRQRGKDEADASLLVEGDDSTGEVDVVIGAVESNQANHRAAHDLEPTLAIETKKPTAALLGFWRNFNVLAGARTARTCQPAFGITTGHGHEQPNSSKFSTPVRLALAAVDGATPHLVSGCPNFRPFS